MKYQHFAVIFVIILLPIVMVLSYYIQTQSETLTLLSNYQTKLIDSTYDAVSAYQINSLNTQRVTGESVKSYVLASVNTFFTTLATNLGMSNASKQNLFTYVPAILFTTYDGYYIYSPIKTSKIAENPENGQGLQTAEGDVIYIKEGATVDKNMLKNCAETKPSNDTLDTNHFTTNISQAKIEYNYMLKPFIYYSAQYKDRDNYNFVASYSLDNYVTLYGNMKGTDNPDLTAGETDSFSKSGYLIDPRKITLEGRLLVKGVSRNADGTSRSEPSEPGVSTYRAIANANAGPDDRETKNNVRYLSVDVKDDKAYNYINYYNFAGHGEGWYDGATGTGRSYEATKAIRDELDPSKINYIRYQKGDDIIEATLDIEEEVNAGLNPRDLLVASTYQPITVTYNDGTDIIEITDRNAKEYYIKAYFFSRWVQENLGEVTADKIVQSLQIAGRSEYTDFTGDGTKIFNFIDTAENDPEREDSPFYEHKRNVIKNSIQFNLNTAISTYTTSYFGSNLEESYLDTDFQLPVLTEGDWDSILNNVTMTTFMQGLKCGTSIFNNYAVVKSNNNNTSVSLDSLYFTSEIGTVAQSNNTYHKYDCAELLNANGAKPGNEISSDGTYLSDLSAEFKYDAKQINTKILGYTDERVICFLDDSTNTYYSIKDSTYTDVLAIGEKLPNAEHPDIENYEGMTYSKDALGNWIASGQETKNLTELPNGSELAYIFDHQNLGCYDCIVSGNYHPTVTFYQGQLRRLIPENDSPNAELFIEMGPGRYQRMNASTNGGDITVSGTGISNTDFLNLKKSVYTALAKQKNLLYKTNEYINR